MNDADLMGSLLRPSFTKKLAARLSQGASINLTAPHGMGRRRTLQDLLSVLPPDMRVLYTDMKFCLNDFPATLRELRAQARCDDATIANLGSLIESLSGNPAPALLILHNVDLLRSAAHDPLYDSALLPHLVAIKAHAQLSLLTVSETLYPDWPLPCEPLPIPSLD